MKTIKQKKAIIIEIVKLLLKDNESTNKKTRKKFNLIK